MAQYRDDCVPHIALAVLLRCVVELDTDKRTTSPGPTLADDSLVTLRFDECSRFVGHDTLGLAYGGGGSDQARRRHSRTIKEPHMIETTEPIVDVSDQFKCLKAEQRDADVLILRKLDAPVQRADGDWAEYELEYRWLNNPRYVCCAQGNEFTFWRPDEIAGWENKSLFDVFRLFP